MLIYDVLKKDHDKLKPLLAELVQMGESEADAEDREKLITQIRDELIPHSRAEEAVFYNSLRSIDASKDVVMHAYGEHVEAEGLLRTLQAMEMINADWTAIARRLKDALEHHIKEEETTVFDAARQVLVLHQISFSR
jgi:hemerythrin-like domain-containing protein